MNIFKVRQIYLLFILILSGFLITGCGGGGETGHWFPTQLVTIEVTPPNQSIAKGTTQQFMATGIYSNNTKRDLTQSVTWTSSNPAVATISNTVGFSGLATSKAIGGPITITASDPTTGKVGTATLTVTNATLVSIGVTPVNPSIARGTKLQFIATGIFTDATTQNLTSSVSWKSSDETVATISNAAGFNGLATSSAVSAPSITITATDLTSGIFGNTTLIVTPATLLSIGVTPVNPSIARGTKQQFIATGIFTAGPPQDLTPFVTWKSSDETKATISNAVGSNGLATSSTTGITTITATYTDPITLSLTSGTTTLTITTATLVSIGVTPVNPSIALGIKQQFKATGIFTAGPPQDLTSFVTWSTLPLVSPVASISNAAGSNGLATSLTTGTTTITATDPTSGIFGSTTLQVTAATLISIGVTPVNPSIALGTKQQFIATGIFTAGPPQDLTSFVTWKTTPLVSAVASISNAAGSNGLATSLTAGTTTITATYADPITLSLTSGTTTLTVTPVTLVSIAITPINASVALGIKQQFKATGIFTAGPPQDLTSSVTWKTVPLVSTVASISNVAGSNGLATSLTVGTTTITATDPSTGIISAIPATLAVTPATLLSIAVTPVNPSIALGTKQQFMATGLFTDLTTQDLTSFVTWKTTPLVSTVASISNAPGSNGLATSLTTGTTTITATYTDPITLVLTSGSTTLTVTPATLVSIAVTPATAGIGVGDTQQFIATGTYTDATTQDLTSSMTWKTTPLVSAIATISNAPGSNGVATALTVGGPITITATDPTNPLVPPGTAQLTVTNAPNLRLVKSFGTFGGSAGMTNQGTLTVINGNIGTIATAATSVTGFHDTEGDIFTETGSNIGAVNGTIYTCTNSTTGPNSTGVNAAYCALATQARLDAQTAYLALAAMPSNGVLAGNLAGTTIHPGVYTNASSVLIQGGNLTLDALGDANAIFVFQIGSTLTVGGPGAAFPQSIILAGSAQAKNVFWQVGTFATINAGGGGTMVGTIISQAGASFSTAGNVALVTLNGRALSLGASVTMVNTVVNVP